MPFHIERSNIALMQCDAIVNATDRRLSLDAGVAMELRRLAGEGLYDELQTIGFCEYGKCIVTGGYALKAKHIIHTVGPVYIDGAHGEDALLRSCYQTVLSTAQRLGAASLALPLISAGSKGYPIDRVLSAAVSEIGAFLMQNDMDVTLVVYDAMAYSLSSVLFPVENTLDEVDAHRADEAAATRPKRIRRKPFACGSIHPSASCSLEPPCDEHTAHPNVLCAESAAFSIDDIPLPTGETFSHRLFRLIDRKGLTDAEVYRRANLTKSHFSKIRCNEHYQPKKNTVLALAVALELNYDQTLDLLKSAGYTFSPASRADAVVAYFIRNKRYNIIEINIALFDRGEKVLAE